MAGKTFTAFLAPGFPVVVLLGGDKVLSTASGRSAATHQLTDGKQDTPKPLNLRWFGHGMEAAKTYWSWLKPAGRQAEEKFLTLDLLFPLFYGGALAASLWWVWMALDRPFHPAWIIAPLAMIAMADWTENLIQLAQLRHYVSPTERHIQNLWIQLSSCATIIRLWLTNGLYVTLAGLILNMLLAFSSRRMAIDAAE